jgi:peptide/nickel transport system substrate-binding protein
MGVRRSLWAAVLCSLVGLGLTACGGASAVEPETTSEPGTLYILRENDFEHLDPRRCYVTDCLNFGRLITRALTMYQAEPGTASLEVVPDLPTDVGRASPDKTTWTFTLKDGVKFEDGTPVTAQDVKYGVERGFAPEIAEGPPGPANGWWAETTTRGRTRSLTAWPRSRHRTTRRSSSTSTARCPTR